MTINLLNARSPCQCRRWPGWRTILTRQRPKGPIPLPWTDEQLRQLRELMARPGIEDYMLASYAEAHAEQIERDIEEHDKRAQKIRAEQERVGADLLRRALGGEA